MNGDKCHPLRWVGQTSKTKVQYQLSPAKQVVDVCCREPAVISSRRVDLVVSLSSAPPPPTAWLLIDNTTASITPPCHKLFAQIMELLTDWLSLLFAVTWQCIMFSCKNSQWDAATTRNIMACCMLFVLSSKKKACQRSGRDTILLSCSRLSTAWCRLEHTLCGSVWLAVCWSVRLAVCRSVRLAVCRSVWLAVCLLDHIVCLSADLSA